jgi:ribosomal protein S18 acetylase RimI-like enzyme
MKFSKEQIIDVLTDSFLENKSVNYIIRKDKFKRKRVAALMEYSYEHANAFGKVYHHPTQPAFGLLIDTSKKKTTIQSMYWNLKFVFKCVGIKNLKNVITREKILQSKLPKEKFYHLWFVGVSKGIQGKGIGSELIQQILTDCKDAPLCLETSMPQNFPFYEKLGFECYEEMTDLGYLLKFYKFDSSI